MSLDTSTLYLVATMVAATLGAMLLFFGTQENFPALRWWGTAYLLGAVSVALSTLAGNMLGAMLSLALNAVGFAACGMVWSAARVFHGRPPNLPGLLLGAMVWVAAVMTLKPEASAIRFMIGAAIVAIYATLTAAQLWSERRKTLQRRWPAIVVPVLHGFVLMLPILLGGLLRPHDAAFVGSIWVTVFSIELVLYAVATVFVIFMLVSERVVTAHKTAASTDPLTGMFNRRGFAEATSRVIEREANAGRPVTVLIFDIDHFKSINDRFGHPAGDEILKLFSVVIGASLRISDLAGRIGGEEFAALLDGLGASHAAFALHHGQLFRIDLGFSSDNITKRNETCARDAGNLVFERLANVEARLVAIADGAFFEGAVRMAEPGSPVTFTEKRGPR
jgi:GGDEF domain-containing protein